MTLMVLPAKVMSAANVLAVNAPTMTAVAASVLAHFMANIRSPPCRIYFRSARALLPALVAHKSAFGARVACLGSFRALDLVVVLVHRAAARRALHREEGRRAVHRTAAVFHVAGDVHDGAGADDAVLVAEDEVHLAFQ